ncbi:MAG: cell division protein ZipA [Gammaproteobacteria bacterium]|nr:cell division protein ZipA [Gammaproteobacteria bacterium]
MEDLRIILAIVGGLVIAGIWFHYRQKGAAQDDDFDRREADEIQELLDEPIRDESLDDTGSFEDLPKFTAVDEVIDDDPSLGVEGIDEGVDEDDRSEAVHASNEKQKPTVPRRQEKIIALMILPRDPDHRFWGADLMDVFERAGLEYGEFDIFHRVHDTGEGLQSVFSVASATEPGSFDISEMPEQYFKGLSLFMLLPGPRGGVAAFADLLATARRIAEQIGGDVKDHNRSTMTKQTAKHVREEIIAFEHRLQQDS